MLRVLNEYFHNEIVLVELNPIQYNNKKDVYVSFRYSFRMNCLSKMLGLFYLTLILVNYIYIYVYIYIIKCNNLIIKNTSAIVFQLQFALIEKYNFYH